MIIAKTNPIGVDFKIDLIQIELDLALSAKLGSWNNYPRVYLNPDNSGAIKPEYYHSVNRYDDVLFNDKFDCTSFFYTDPVADELNGQSRMKVHWVAQMKLSKLFTEPHRADEEFRQTMNVIFRQSPYVDEYLGSVWGEKKVYEDFKTDKLKFIDMSQTHVVRFSFNVLVENDCICC